MNSDEKLDQLLKDIALKHKTTLSREDPILMLHTINSHLIAEGEKAQVAGLREFAEKIEAVTQQWEKASQERADRVLNAALDVGKNTLDRGLAASASSWAARLEKENAKLSNENKKQISRLTYLFAGNAFLLTVVIAFMAAELFI